MGEVERITQSIVREMTITHRDFFRLLPKALREYPFQRLGLDKIKVSCEDGDIFILLSAERIRRIAELKLYVVDVTFRLEGVTAMAKQDFFSAFDRGYQRGGG